MTLDDQRAFVEEFLLATYKPTIVRARRPEATACEHLYDIWTALERLGALCEFPDELCDKRATKALVTRHFRAHTHTEDMYCCQSVLDDSPQTLSEHCGAYYRLWKLRILEQVLKTA